MKLKLIGLSLIACLSLANAQNNIKITNAKNQILGMVNNPQYSNDILNNQQYQNNTELVMSIMKNIENKKIQDADKKIEFVNSFDVSSDIKNQVINYIKQDMAYSDFEKVSYGVYFLKTCVDKEAPLQTDAT